MKTSQPLTKISISLKLQDVLEKVQSLVNENITKHILLELLKETISKSKNIIDELSQIKTETLDKIEYDYVFRDNVLKQCSQHIDSVKDLLSKATEILQFLESEN